MNRHGNALRLLESAFLARMLGSNETSYIGEDARDGGQQRADTSERVGPLSFQDSSLRGYANEPFWCAPEPLYGPGPPM